LKTEVNILGIHMKVVFFVAGSLVGAYFNTAVLSVASACCTATGQAIALIGKQIIHLAA
jgi:hypothetical protein